MTTSDPTRARAEKVEMNFVPIRLNVDIGRNPSGNLVVPQRYLLSLRVPSALKALCLEGTSSNCFPSIFHIKQLSFDNFLVQFGGFLRRSRSKNGASDNQTETSLIFA